MKLARTLTGAGTSQGANAPVIVARELPNSGKYEARLLQLATAMPSPRWAVQADVPGPRSDRSFYNRLGVEDVGPFSTLLQSAPPSVAISVRLHGAIAALLAGVPAIHLAYERKGWGAYEDLGLNDYVHDARNFDPAAVAKQARELAADASGMWRLLEASRSRLIEQYELMVEDLRRLLCP